MRDELKADGPLKGSLTRSIKGSLKRGAGLAVVVVVLSACGGPPLTPAAPAPLPAPAPISPPRAATARVLLPGRIPATTWRVQSVSRISMSSGGGVNAAANEQRVETAGVVSWSSDRLPSGALRASGQVDSFTVRTSFDAPRNRLVPTPTVLVLLEATLDSALLRVATRPPLANECDRPETAASVLARELLVRVPNGIAAGDRWKDSSVTLVCRGGVPMTVYTSIISNLEMMDDDRLVVRREITGRLEGQGGSPFRALQLAGTSSGSQRVEIAAQRGTVERLEGSGTLTLTATERLPGSPPRIQQIVQRSEISAVRAR